MGWNIYSFWQSIHADKGEHVVIIRKKMVNFSECTTTTSYWNCLKGKNVHLKFSKVLLPN